MSVRILQWEQGEDRVTFVLMESGRMGMTVQQGGDDDGRTASFGLTAKQVRELRDALNEAESMR